MKRLLYLTFLLCACASNRPMIAVEENIWMISSHDSPRVVMFEFRNKKPSEYQTSRSGNLRFTTNNDDWNISVFVEKCGECSTSVQCRDYVLSKQPPQIAITEIEKGNDDSTATLTFMVKSAWGVPFVQKSFYKEFVRDGYWWDIHLSKANYKETDSSFADSVMNRIMYVPKNIAEPD